MRTAEEKEPSEQLDELQDAMYGRITRWIEKWKTRLLFYDTGTMRLAAIVGYLQGLKHAGQEEFATKLLLNLVDQLEYLGGSDSEIQIQFADANGDKVETKVPSRKVILADDGCLHSFSFAAYVPVNPDQYWDRRIAHSTRMERRNYGRHTNDAHDEVVKELQITERVNYRDAHSTELTEHRNINGEHHRVYYRYAYNGGLIYHGPGSGETFSIVVGSSPTLWSIHT